VRSCPIFLMSRGVTMVLSTRGITVMTDDTAPTVCTCAIIVIIIIIIIIIIITWCGAVRISMSAQHQGGITVITDDMRRAHRLHLHTPRRRWCHFIFDQGRQLLVTILLLINIIIIITTIIIIIITPTCWKLSLNASCR
jgi:amino acid transporter